MELLKFLVPLAENNESSKKKHDIKFILMTILIISFFCIHLFQNYSPHLYEEHHFPFLVFFFFIVTFIIFSSVFIILTFQFGIRVSYGIQFPRFVITRSLVLKDERQSFIINRRNVSYKRFCVIRC